MVKLVEAAELIEFNSFAENDTFEIISKTKMRPGAKIVSARELLQWKVPGKKVKCRVVLRGFQDNRTDLQTDSPTLRPESFRLLLAFAADHHLEQLAVDLKTAFLQGYLYGEEELIYWNPPKRFRDY